MGGPTMWRTAACIAPQQADEQSSQRVPAPQRRTVTKFFRAREVLSQAVRACNDNETPEIGSDIKNFFADSKVNTKQQAAVLINLPAFKCRTNPVKTVGGIDTLSSIISPSKCRQCQVFRWLHSR